MIPPRERVWGRPPAMSKEGGDTNAQRRVPLGLGLAPSSMRPKTYFQWLRRAGRGEGKPVPERELWGEESQEQLGRGRSANRCVNGLAESNKSVRGPRGPSPFSVGCNTRLGQGSLGSPSPATVGSLISQPELPRDRQSPDLAATQGGAGEPRLLRWHTLECGIPSRPICD